MAWLDTGTCDSLSDAGSYILLLEHRQRLKVGCPALQQVGARAGCPDTPEELGAPLEEWLRQRGKCSSPAVSDHAALQSSLEVSDARCNRKTTTARSRQGGVEVPAPARWCSRWWR